MCIWSAVPIIFPIEFPIVSYRHLRNSGCFNVFNGIQNPWPLRCRCNADLPTELWSHTVGSRSFLTLGSCVPAKGLMKARYVYICSAGYCWFSLTWSTAMFFNENKRKRLHNNRVKFPEDLVGAPTWPPFLCLGHQHGGRDVIWKPRIGLIHDSRHVGFQIVMQISHVLCCGANIEKKANCGKSARRDIEIILLKVHFSI